MTQKAIKMLSGIKLKVLDLPDGKDPAGLTPEQLDGLKVQTSKNWIQGQDPADENYEEDDSENQEGYNEMIEWIESTEVSYLVKEGKSARLGVETENTQAEKILVEYRLNKVDNYWRVNQISNLEEIIKTSFLNELEELLSF